MTVSLSERAMLVTLSRSQWGGERTDRVVSKELTMVKSASERSARVVKKLLPPEALAGVQAATGQARKLHYSYTLPWRDEGPRILRSAIYSEYIALMREAKQACLREEATFYRNYDVFKDAGMAELGDMVRPEDYPSVDEIKAMFKFALDVTPIPTGNDFRVDVPNADKLKAAIDNDTEAAAKAGIRIKLEEAAGIIEHMATKLAQYTPGEEGKRATGTFRDSLVENVRDLANMLPKLNLFEDPEIDKLAGRLTDLGVWEPDQLRKSESARVTAQQNAEEILDRVKEMLG